MVWPCVGVVGCQVCWKQLIAEMLLVPTCSNSMGVGVGVDPRPTKVARAVAEKADVAPGRVQHCLHVVLRQKGVQLMLTYGCASLFCLGMGGFRLSYCHNNVQLWSIGASPFCRRALLYGDWCYLPGPLVLWDYN